MEEQKTNKNCTIALGYKLVKREDVKIKEIREKKGLSQKGMAMLLGISRQQLVNIEKGKNIPSVKIALDTAKILNSTVENLWSHLEEQ